LKVIQKLGEAKRSNDSRQVGLSDLVKDLAVVLDLCSRALVRWSMAHHRRAERVTQALSMALGQRQPAAGLLMPTDRGSPYGADSYRPLLRQHGMPSRMRRKGNWWDNAVAESFFATIKAELLDRQPWPTRTTAHNAIFEWIEGWYNPHRRHSSLGYLSPEKFEHEFAAELESRSSELLPHSRQTARRVRLMRKSKSKTTHPNKRRTSTNHIIH